MRRFENTPVFRALVTILVLAGTGVGAYFREYYATEAAAALLILTFLVTLSKARLRQGELKPILVCAVFPIAWATLYAVVFSLRNGTGVFPSLAAQRDLVFVLIGPLFWLLFRAGWSRARLERVTVAGLLIATLIYLYGTWGFDLQTWLASEDLHKSSLVVFDSSRGLRLKGPQHVLLFAALYYTHSSWKSHRILSFLRPPLAVIAWALLVRNMPRTILLSTILALLTYYLFLSRRRRLANLLIVVPLIAGATLVFAVDAWTSFQAAFSSDWSYIARADTYENAFEGITAYPFLGMGHDSYGSITYRDLYGELFYPSDVGIVGVAFEYGLLGAFFYILLAFWLTRSLLLMIWEERSARLERPTRVFTWSLFIVCLTILLASPIQAQFAREPGILLASLVWAFVMISRASDGDALRAFRETEARTTYALQT